MDAVVPLEGLEAAFGRQHAFVGVKTDPQARHPGKVCAHMGFADQRGADTAGPQMVADGLFADPERDEIPAGAMRIHVPAV